MNKHTEIRFEEAIEQHLIDHGGYVHTPSISREVSPR